MHAPYRLVLVALACSLSCCLWLAAAAQAQDDVRTQLAALPVATITGKVVGFQQGEIYMTTATEDPYIIHVLDKSITEVIVIGTAKRDFLRPGVFFRFTTTEMDKKGNVKGDLSEMAVFEPAETSLPGVHSDDPEGKAGPWFVGGQIKSISKTGKAVIIAGKVSVKVTIPEDAAIDLMLSDYSLIKEGDEITVNGRLAKPTENVAGKTQAAIAVGETIQIKLAEPATPPGKKKPRTAKPKPEPAAETPKPAESTETPTPDEPAETPKPEGSTETPQPNE